MEDSHGLLRTSFLFFVPGVGGNILSAIFLPQYISVGASGGIFGLIGGCIADISLNWKLLFIGGREHETSVFRRNFTAILCLVVEVVINLMIGLTPYVDNFSHLGGMVYGLMLGLSSLQALPVGFFGVSASRLEKFRTVTVRFFGVILSVVLIIITIAILATMKAGDSPCPRCRYISCVPFPPLVEEKWWYCDDCDFVTATLYRSPDGNYDIIDLFCPGGATEVISINGTLGSDQEVLRRKLPSFCRESCPN
jgi:Rhomboid family